MSSEHTQTTRWHRGEIVVARYVGLGRTFFAALLIVDHDDERSAGVYKAPGMPARTIVPADGSPLPRVVPPGYFERTATTVVEQSRSGRPSLILMPVLAAYAIHVRWNEDTWNPDGFYVNLQTPVVRDHLGFRVIDHFLDIVVHADLSWTWKDEEELTEAVDVGRLTSAESAAITRQGERVIEDVEARRWPFDGQFDDWRPDPAWAMPQFPDNGKDGG